MTLALVTRLALVRIVRLPRLSLGLLPWLLVTLAAAWVARRGAGVDRAMLGTFGAFVLPLACYAVVGAVVGPEGLKRAVQKLVSLGGDRTVAALGTTLASVLASSVAGALFGALTCAISHRPGDPPLALDLFASTWVGALGGAAYGALFTAGAAFGRGRLRSAFLMFDWILGAGGVGVFLMPRGHLRALLGGPLAAGLGARASFGVLLVLVLGWGLVAVRAGRKLT